MEVKMIKKILKALLLCTIAGIIITVLNKVVNWTTTEGLGDLWLKGLGGI